MRSKHKWFTDNPGDCVSLTLTTYEITATAAGDTVTAAGVEALPTGTEIIVALDGGTAEGITSGETYYVVASAANTIKLATTYANAIAGTVVDITGDGGVGDIYPVYDVNSFLYIGTGDALSIRGILNLGKNKGGYGETAGTPDASDVFCLHKNITNGTLWPFAIGQIHSYVSSGTCVSDLIMWRQ